MSHNLVKRELNSEEKSASLEKTGTSECPNRENKLETELNKQEILKKIFYYMSKYISCHNEARKSFSNLPNSENKISYSLDKEEKDSEDKDEIEESSEKFQNNFINEEDFLYYRYLGPDHLDYLDETRPRKESEAFHNVPGLNFKQDNTNLALYDHSNFFIKKDCEQVELNFENYEDHIVKKEADNSKNSMLIDPNFELRESKNVNPLDSKFSDAEIKIVKEFYDSLRMQYDIFHMKHLPRINPENSSRIRFQTKSMVPGLNSSDSFSSRKRNKYLMCSEIIKELCINRVKVEGEDPRIVAKELNVPLKSLKRWLEVGAARKKGGGRKIKDPVMEKKLYNWYVEYHDKNKKLVTAKLIKQKALEYTDRKDFHASKGWLEKYKKKYNLQISKESEVKNREKNKI